MTHNVPGKMNGIERMVVTLAGQKSAEMEPRYVYGMDVGDVCIIRATDRRDMCNKQSKALEAAKRAGIRILTHRTKVMNNWSVTVERVA